MSPVKHLELVGLPAYSIKLFHFVSKISRKKQDQFPFGDEKVHFFRSETTQSKNKATNFVKLVGFFWGFAAKKLRKSDIKAENLLKSLRFLKKIG